RPGAPEVRQGSVLGATATRAGGPGGLRPHAGQPLPTYGTVPQMAHGQEANRLHLCATRSCSAAGVGGDLWQSLNAPNHPRNHPSSANLQVRKGSSEARPRPTINPLNPRRIQNLDDYL